MMQNLSRRLLLALVALVGLGAAPMASADDVAEFIGRSDQNGTVITHYGYVTHVPTTEDANLFFDPADQTEATAKLTYFATTTLNARHVLGNIITTATLPGALTFFLRASGGATFSDPASFAVGTPVATFTLRYYNVLNVQGTNSGGQSIGIASATASGEGSGLRLRITATGEGTLLSNDPANFVSVFLIGGSIVTDP
jgi:hypothetical protein